MYRHNIDQDYQFLPSRLEVRFRLTGKAHAVHFAYRPSVRTKRSSRSASPPQFGSMLVLHKRRRPSEVSSSESTKSDSWTPTDCGVLDGACEHTEKAGDELLELLLTSGPEAVWKRLRTIYDEMLEEEHFAAA